MPEQVGHDGHRRCMRRCQEMPDQVGHDGHRHCRLDRQSKPSRRTYPVYSG